MQCLEVHKVNWTNHKKQKCICQDAIKSSDNFLGKK